MVGFLVWSLNCVDPLCAETWLLERKTLTELYRGERVEFYQSACSQKIQIKRL